MAQGLQELLWLPQALMAQWLPQAPMAQGLLARWPEQALPEQQRKVVVLRHWLGLSVAETAGELGISEGTVKSHSSRGLAALQRTLTTTD